MTESEETPPPLEDERQAPSNERRAIERWQEHQSQSAAAEIVNRYADRLYALAAGQMYYWLRARTSPDSVVQSVFNSVLEDLAGGRVHPLPEGDPLWPLLA